MKDLEKRKDLLAVLLILGTMFFVSNYEGFDTPTGQLMVRGQDGQLRGYGSQPINDMQRLLEADNGQQQSYADHTCPQMRISSCGGYSSEEEGETINDAMSETTKVCKQNLEPCKSYVQGQIDQKEDDCKFADMCLLTVGTLTDNCEQFDSCGEYTPTGNGKGTGCNYPPSCFTVDDNGIYTNNCNPSEGSCTENYPGGNQPYWKCLISDPELGSDGPYCKPLEAGIQ